MSSTVIQSHWTGCLEGRVVASGNVVEHEAILEGERASEWYRAGPNHALKLQS